MAYSACRFNRFFNAGKISYNQPIKMNKNLNRLLLLLVGTLLFLSCQKELNFPINSVHTPGTSGGTAKYKFAGGTGTCANAKVSGTYSTGTPLTDKNLITLTVMVDSIGSYALATASINGVIFSGSGDFISIGNQSIVLRGSGTPATAGNFNFIPGSSGCTFPVTFSAKSSGAAQFTLNGAPDSCITPVVSGKYVAGTSLDATNTVVMKVSVVTPGTYAVSTNAVNGVIFSASGTFTSAGQQSVTLTGSGNPLKSGVFTFTPGTYGCKLAINFTE
jgi:hypothetical protein